MQQEMWSSIWFEDKTMLFNKIIKIKYVSKRGNKISWKEVILKGILQSCPELEKEGKEFLPRVDESLDAGNLDKGAWPWGKTLVSKEAVLKVVDS